MWAKRENFQENKNSFANLGDTQLRILSPQRMTKHMPAADWRTGQKADLIIEAYLAEKSTNFIPHFSFRVLESLSRA